jgi:hypothetical protein
MLLNQNLYLQAYAKLYPNKGALTPGATPETVDEMSLRKIDRIIKALRYERYQWTPVRRTYIKKGNGKLRSLGLPMVSSYCTSYKEFWDSRDIDGGFIEYNSFLEKVTRQLSEGRRDQRWRIGLRSYWTISGVSLIQRGPRGLARIQSNRPASHQAATVETWTFNSSATALVE